MPPGAPWSRGVSGMREARLPLQEAKGGERGVPEAWGLLSVFHNGKEARVSRNWGSRAWWEVM